MAISPNTTAMTARTTACRTASPRVSSSIL
jgi:hypothetical protein